MGKCLQITVERLQLVMIQVEFQSNRSHCTGRQTNQHQVLQVRRPAATGIREESISENNERSNQRRKKKKKKKRRRRPRHQRKRHKQNETGTLKTKREGRKKSGSGKPVRTVRRQTWRCG